MNRGASSPLMVVVVLAMLAMGCSSESGLAGSPVSRTEGTTTSPSSTTAPSATSTSSPVRTSPPTTSERSTTADLPDLGPGPVIATAQEAEALLALTTIDAQNPPPELTARIDEVLRTFIVGDLVDAQFFEAMDRLTPTQALGEAYLICDVEALGPLCVATEPDYLEWVNACRAVGGVLIERLVTEGDGWAATGLCLWDDEPDMMASASGPSLG